MPYFRSGVRFDFPVRHAHGATLRVTLDDGDDLPAGAYIEIDDRPERFPVAGQGVAHLTGITGRHRLHATWRAQRCDIDAPLPPSRDPLPDLGTLTCHGVAR